MVGGAPLSGEGGFYIGMGNVLVARIIKVQGLGLAAFDLNRRGARHLINGKNFTLQPIDTVCITIISCETDAVSGLKLQRLRDKGLAVTSTPLPQAPVHIAPAFRFEGDRGLGRIDPLHPVGLAA